MNAEMMEESKLEAANVNRLFVSLFKDETGSELVETAFCLWLWIMCVMGLIYGSFGMYAVHFVSAAAEDAARYAIVRGSSWNGKSCETTATLQCTATSNDVSNYVVGLLPAGLSSDNLSVTASWPAQTANGIHCDTEYGANSPYCMVNVTVTYNLKLLFPLFKASAIPISGSAQMTIVS